MNEENAVKKKNEAKLLTLPINSEKSTSTFRVVTELETASWTDLPAGVHVLALNKSRALRIRQMGKVKRWKRDPVEIMIPCKFGMYESFHMDNAMIREGRVLMHVPEVQIPIEIEVEIPTFNAGYYGIVDDVRLSGTPNEIDRLE
jgi:uncharacterized protein YcsI (UPF0317 family)